MERLRPGRDDGARCLSPEVAASVTPGYGGLDVDDAYFGCGTKPLGVPAPNEGDTVGALDEQG